MARTAIGQSTRDRMARNSRSLDARFSSEAWRASKFTSPHQRAFCAAKTAKGERCWGPVGYGALEDTPGRPTLDNPATVFYCHRHASALLKAEHAT